MNSSYCRGRPMADILDAISLSPEFYASLNPFHAFWYVLILRIIFISSFLFFCPPAWGEAKWLVGAIPRVMKRLFFVEKWTPCGEVRRLNWTIVLIIFGPLAAHLIFVLNPGYERDIELFKMWGIIGAQYGPDKVYDHYWCDYPPAYLEVLTASEFMCQKMGGRKYEIQNGGLVPYPFHNGVRP
jgi:hypothetical protein